MIPTTLLQKGAADFSVQLSPEQLEQFDTYCSFLIEYNEKVNLTAITDPDGVAIRHFVDSLAIIGLVTLPQGAALVDVGTGAGFPGVPIKMVRPDIKLTLLDSLAKRLTFLDLLCEKLKIKAKTVHHRAETAGVDATLRGKFDVATARAVASLAVLAEYCLPLVKVGGFVLALKGPDCAQELQEAQKAIHLLGGGEAKSIEYQLPDGSGRTLVLIPKRAPTPKKYPRQRVNLSEKPL